MSRSSRATSGVSTATEDPSMNLTLESPLTSTPRTRTKIMLRKACITLNRNSGAYRRLVLGNAIGDSSTGQREQKEKIATAGISK